MGWVGGNTIAYDALVSQVSGAGPLSDSDVTGQTIGFVVPFTFGVPFDLGFRLTADGNAISDGNHSNIDAAGASGEFGNTAYWEGITGISAGGEPLTLDDVVVASESGSDYTGSMLCAGDFNHDGFVNGDDYDFFAEGFETGDPSADFNLDGFVNGDDYDAFAEHFEVGC